MINRFANMIRELNSSKSISIIRLGNVEATQMLIKEGVYPEMRTNAGWFGSEEELKLWKKQMLTALLNANLNLRVVTCPSFYVCDDVFTTLNLFCPTLPYVEDIVFWITLINALNTTKLGFVSYFKKDMDLQIPKLNFIHKKSRGFTLSTKEWRVIYSENTIKGNEPTDKTFQEVLLDLFNRCIKEDRDIYFLSCGSYGIPLTNMLKNAGKKAIYVGGFLQLLFGLKGKRWDDIKIVNQHYNKNWIYPSIKPINGDQVESWCYGS